MSTQSVSTDFSSELKSKIQDRQARVGVIGLGYVGLPLALLYSGQKFSVTGFDIDQHKVDALSEGKSYIYRIPAEDQEARAKGLVATSDFSKLAEMDAIIICVTTPLDEYHEPDLSFITNTAHVLELCATRLHNRRPADPHANFASSTPFAQPTQQIFPRYLSPSR